MERWMVTKQLCSQSGNPLWIKTVRCSACGAERPYAGLIQAKYCGQCGKRIDTIHVSYR